MCNLNNCNEEKICQKCNKNYWDAGYPKNYMTDIQTDKFCKCEIPKKNNNYHCNCKCKNSCMCNANKCQCENICVCVKLCKCYFKCKCCGSCNCKPKCSCYGNNNTPPQEILPDDCHINDKLCIQIKPPTESCLSKLSICGLLLCGIMLAKYNC